MRRVCFTLMGHVVRIYTNGSSFHSAGRRPPPMSAALDMWAALNASRHAVAAQDALVARTEHLVQRWRTRPRGDAHARRRRRKALRHALDGRGGRGGPRRTAGGAPESPDSSWRSGGSEASVPSSRLRLTRDCFSSRHHHESAPRARRRGGRARRRQRRRWATRRSCAS